MSKTKEEAEAWLHEKGERGKPKVDRVELHEYMWEKRSRHDLFKVPTSEVAADFSVSEKQPFLMYRDLLAAGRIKRTRSGIVVLDPELF